MEGLGLLIPIALVLAALGISAFLWAVKSDQYDDLDKSGREILFDDDQEPGQK